VSGRVAHRQQQRYAAEEQQQPSGAYYAAVGQANVDPEPDYVQELERLNQLKNQGVITEEDFQAKKKQLLGL
jgi:hypothetical protein